jgi:hypothetical protein
VFAYNIKDGSTTKFADIKMTNADAKGIHIRSMAAKKDLLFVLLSSGELVVLDKKGAENQPRIPSSFKPGQLTIWKGELIASSIKDNKIFQLNNAIWTPIAGSGQKGTNNGKAAEAAFNAPSGVASLNGELIISDRGNDMLRKLSSPKQGTVRTLNYVPGREIIGEAAAHTEGEVVVADTILVAKSNTKIHVALDLGGYKLVPEFSLIDMDEYTGAFIETQQVTEDGFDFLVNGRFEGIDVYLELYLLLEDPNNAGVYLIKRSYLSFYIERVSSAPSAQEQVYKVNILPQ